jgi:hypothetical protein
MDFPTISAANAVAVAGDSILVSYVGSPYVESLELVSGVVYMGGWDDSCGSQTTDPSLTVVELHPDSVGSVVECTDVADSTIFGAFTVRGGNSEFAGGGIFCGSGADLVIRNCIIRENRSAVIGGGITIGNGSSATIFNCTIENNVSVLRGGGISVAANADAARIEQCRILACTTAVFNQTSGGGGGLFIASPIVFAHNKIRYNVSGNDGGGLLALDADVICQSNEFEADSSARHGGAVAALGGNGLYWGCLVEECVAGGSGGGFYFEGGANLIHEGFVRNNRSLQAGGYGGGFYFFESDETFLKTTEIVGNTAEQGGGIAIRGNASRRFTSVHLVSNTITRNRANISESGGNIHVYREFLGPFVNNVISDQLKGYGIYCLGVLAQPNLRHNCVYKDDGSDPDSEYGGSCTDRTGVSGNIKVDPLLCDPLAVPIPDLALQSDSPCVGAGEDGVDIGAHSGAKDCGTISIEETSWGSLKARYR